MKIGFFSTAPLKYGGGFERFIIEVSRYLSNRGHEIKILTTDQLLWRDEKRLGENEILSRIGKANFKKVSFNTFPSKRFRWILFPKRHSFSEIYGILSNCDIIYSKNDILELLVLFRSLKKKLPVICGVHTPLYYNYINTPMHKLHNIVYMSGYYRDLLKRCIAIHVLNSKDRYITSNHHKISKEKIFLVPNGISINRFKPFYRKMGRKLKILFVGRLIEQKGVDILSRIINEFFKGQKFNDIHFSIIGKGKMEMEALKLSQNFKNYVTYSKYEKDLNIMYNKHDVVILPSRFEGLSTVALEAHSCGVPVIGSRIPGIEEIVEDRLSGYLVEPENVEGFKKAIISIYNLKRYAPTKFYMMKKYAREKILKEFSQDKNFKKIENFFIEISRRHS